MIYDNFNSLGKNNIKSTRSDLIRTIGETGMKDIIRKVFSGGNVRDITEFITQRRLISSYASTLELFVNSLSAQTESFDVFSDFVCSDLLNARGARAKLLDLWLIGLTNKGLDNIVRTQENINEYKDSFSTSLNDAIADVEHLFGNLTGSISLNGHEVNISWKFLALLLLCVGSQTLSIRGSAKSMNGKLFEKLLLGTLISIMGFKYCKTPPETILPKEKLFWLSNMDENERETDATIVYNGNAVSIDIGFIGKGNPEISLDKVSRFNRYKQIAGIGHNMKTIVIVDTVSENSDLFNKAKKIDGHVLQMSKNNWTIDFAQLICDIFGIEHCLSSLTPNILDNYFKREIEAVNIKQFIS